MGHVLHLEVAQDGASLRAWGKRRGGGERGGGVKGDCEGDEWGGGGRGERGGERGVERFDGGVVVWCGGWVVYLFVRTISHHLCDVGLKHLQ